jgi:predicted negative regulator of RcsB-dependent stress response
MAYKIRVVHKKQDLKKPDEFVSTMDWLIEASRRHAKILLGIFGGLVLLGAGIGAFVWYGIKQEDSAAALGVEAFRLFQAASTESVVPPPQAPSSTQGETVPSKRDENFRKAIDLFQQIVSNYPRTKTAVLSRYSLGNSYLELGDYESAISAYQAFIRLKSAPPALVALAQQRLAYAFIGKGDLAQAEKSFEAVVMMKEAFNKDHSLFEIGKLKEAQGKKEEAIQKYQEIVKGYPDSLLVSEAKTRLQVLGVVEPPPPMLDTPSTPATPSAVAPGTTPSMPVQTPQPEPAPEIPPEKK